MWEKTGIIMFEVITIWIDGLLNGEVLLKRPWSRTHRARQIGSLQRVLIAWHGIPLHAVSETVSSSHWKM